jgi:hypothetical protein
MSSYEDFFVEKKWIMVTLLSLVRNRYLPSGHYPINTVLPVDIKVIQERDYF